MVHIPKLKTKKLSVSPSSQGATVATVDSMLEPFTGKKNKYENYNEFIRMDPELANAITRLALLASYAYKGPSITIGTDLSDTEKTLEKQAKVAADELDFRGRFFSIAKHLLTHGDYAYVVAAEETTGIRQIQPLPITKMTIVGAEQVGAADAKIQSCDKYVLNEFDAQKQQVFPRNDNEQVFHFSIDNEAEEIYDTQNRWTFGVYSVSPIEALKNRLLWKQAILITDVLWRYRNVPREVHELDTSMFLPDKFQGATWEAQVTAATTAAQAYLKAYATMISKKKVDQGYIVGSNVKKIYYIEPQKTTYSAPNDLINQLNESIREGIGAYSIGKGTYATELVTASYVILMPDHLAYKIKRHLLTILRLHLKKKFNTSDEDLNKIDIRLSLVLDILKGEMVRQMAIIAATGTQTLDELREYVGRVPLTEEQIQRLVTIVAKSGRAGQASQTILDILATASQTEGVTAPITPESRGDKQTT